MNRFFRAAFAATFAYLFLAFIAALASGKGTPLPVFLCLYFGLLLAELPFAMPALFGKEALFVPCGVLLALLGFLFIRLYNCMPIHYIAHALGIIAAAVFFRALRHRTTHDAFAAKFRFSVVLIVAFIGVMYLSLLLGLTGGSVLPIKRESLKQAVDHAVPIAILLLVTGVLLLRGLRGLQGSLDEKAFNRRQLRDLLIYASAVSAVFLVNPYIYSALVWLTGKVVRPAANGIRWLFNRFLELIANKNPSFYEQPLPMETPIPTELELAGIYEHVAEQEPEHYMIEGAAEEGLYNTILNIFIVAAAVVMLIILAIELRKLIGKLLKRGSSRGKGYPNEIREAIEGEEAPKKEKKLRKRSVDPRIRMRYLYGEFLRLMRRVPLRIEPSDTCGRIEERSAPVLRGRSEELSEFTGLYEKARYNESEAPSEQEASRMKALFEALKKSRS